MKIITTKATFYSKSLHKIYPENPAYLGAYIKNLLLIKQYDEAEKEINSVAQMENPFLQAQVTIFKGILQEKKYRNSNRQNSYTLKESRIFQFSGVLVMSMQHMHILVSAA